MIAAVFRRLVLGLVAAAVFATAAAVIVVALAFAFYAFVEPFWGKPAAAASLAGVTGALIGLGGFFLALGAAPRKPKTVAQSAGSGLETIIERAYAYLRDRPIVAIAMAAGAGFLAIRNPTYLGSLIRSILEGDPPERR